MAFKANLSKLNFILMIDKLPIYLAKEIQKYTGLPCTFTQVRVEENIEADSIALFVNEAFISEFELFDEETVEEIAIELLDGQWEEIREVLIS